jgi:hypothetical protein
LYATRPHTMQRFTAIAIGALLVVAIVALVLLGGHRNFLSETAKKDAGPASAAAAQPLIEAGSLDELLFASDIGFDGGTRGLSAPETEMVALLPSGSPKMVRFGVILVQYRGAQAAPPSARSKDEALALARTLAEAARTDFKAQVSKGDPGSMDDAGRIPRGVLEPAIEYALFTLGAGGVSEPLDTPRGYWIVKRIE